MTPDRAAAGLFAQPWAMEPRRLAAFAAQLAQLPELPAETDAGAEAAASKDAPPAQLRYSVTDGTATLSVSGVLLRSVPGWLQKYVNAGYLNLTGYDQLSAALGRATADPNVERLVLSIDSPGGMTSGLVGAADAVIAAAEAMPVAAHVDDLAASAAYWLASRADRVVAVNDTAEIGSIGVYMVIDDYSEMAEKMGIKVHLVRSGPYKGTGVTGVAVPEEELVPFQETVDGLADQFVQAVADGRGLSASRIRQAATGRTWLAPQALELGLIDDTGPRATVFRQTPDQGAQTMTDQKPDTAPQVDLEAERSRAADEARQAERQRVADLKAAFADDPAFALEQIESGAGVQQAQAAYADVLRTRLAEAQATIDDLTDQLAEVTGKADAPSTGAQAVESGDGEEDGQGNFLEQARALAEEKGITKVEAMRRLAKDNPELYAASRGRTA